MHEEGGKQRRKRRERRERRKKRRRSGRDYQPMREGVVIFTLFVGLSVLILVCFWAILPTTLRYLRDSLGW